MYLQESKIHHGTTCTSTWQRKIREAVETRTHKRWNPKWTGTMDTTSQPYSEPYTWYTDIYMYIYIHVPCVLVYNNIFQRQPQGVGARVLKAWHHHPWRRPVMAESSGTASISSLSYRKTSCYEITKFSRCNGLNSKDLFYHVNHVYRVLTIFGPLHAFLTPGNASTEQHRPHCFQHGPLVCPWAVQSWGVTGRISQLRPAN